MISTGTYRSGANNGNVVVPHLQQTATHSDPDTYVWSCWRVGGIQADVVMVEAVILGGRCTGAGTNAGDDLDSRSRSGIAGAYAADEVVEDPHMATRGIYGYFDPDLAVGAGVGALDAVHPVVRYLAFTMAVEIIDAAVDASANDVAHNIAADHAGGLLVELDARTGRGPGTADRAIWRCAGKIGSHDTIQDLVSDARPVDGR